MGRRGEVENFSIRVREKELYPQESSLARKERAAVSGCTKCVVVVVLQSTAVNKAKPTGEPPHQEPETLRAHRTLKLTEGLGIAHTSSSLSLDPSSSSRCCRFRP